MSLIHITSGIFFTTAAVATELFQMYAKKGRSRNVRNVDDSVREGQENCQQGRDEEKG